ncbi:MULTISPECIES: cyclase family protein [Methanosarcina]|uniref:Metal-dependent hydrolase n=1 Tax=Methanosarcina vacuolata Z-761 TaxID=1434123 RepID=A0A0E3Q3R7_9EURY|nr:MULTISPECIES: cyclase family protein [Methanosarcina]AKB42929.1 Metal-dependent hydrolase [Methanosarcina vacuolata Z-761]AKB46415.1 Metal-dependent hydrolase [Methanosarcina sp. Kolksee]
MEEIPIEVNRISINGKIIDITTPISPFTQVFPGDPIPVIEKVCTLEEEGCAVSKLSFGSHTGTHVDAPSHILKNGPTIDKLELKHLMGTALILDFSSQSGELTADILEKAFRNMGAPENIPILLLKTEAFSRKPNSAGKISPPGKESDSQNMEFGKEESGSAYLDEGGAAWIVEKGFKTVGIDSFSVDNFYSETLPAHHILLSGDVNIVECLELSSIKAGTYFFICLPLKIEGCDGAPARALLVTYS